MAEINEQVKLEKENTVLFADSVPAAKINVTPHQQSFEAYVKSWSEKGQGATNASQDIVTMLSRPALLTTFDWAETDLQDQLLKTIEIPGDISSSKFKSSKLKFFRFYRSNFKIRVTINGTRFHSGRLLVIWSAGRAITAMESAIEEMNSLVCFPSVIIDPATNQSAEFTIPFISPLLYMPIQATGSAVADVIQNLVQQMGVLGCYVLNPLTSGQATTTPVSISIYGWFEDPVVSVPIYAQMGVISDVIDGLVPPMTEIVETATDSVTGVSRMLREVGLSKPTQIGANLRITPVVGSSLAQGVGSDTIEKITLDPKACLEPCNELFGTKDDEMDVVYIGKTWALLYRAEWLSTAEAGSRIYTTELYPPSSTSVGYMLRAFKYYCGSVRVRIQLVANQFMTGRIMALYVPWGVDIGDGVPVSELSDEMYNQVYDLTGTSESEFTIPFNAPYPVLPTAHFSQSTSWDYVGIDQHSIGSIKLIVVNPLRTTKATSEKAFVNIYMSFDDDFEVYYPTLVGIAGSIDGERGSPVESWQQLDVSRLYANKTLRQYPTPTLTNSSPLIPQSGTLQEPIDEEFETVEVEVDDLSKELRQVDLFAESGDLKIANEKPGAKKKKPKLEGANPPVQNSRVATDPNPLWVSKRAPGFAAKYNFGERITNLKQVLKRYSAAYLIKGTLFSAASVPSNASATNFIATVTFSTGAGPFMDEAMTSAATTLKNNDAYRCVSMVTFLSYFGALYRYQRGGVRMKFLIGNQPGTSIVAAPGWPMDVSADKNVYANGFIRSPYIAYYPVWPVSSGAGVDQVNYARTALAGRKMLSFLSEGAVAASGDINPNIEIEVPYYSPWMMIPTPQGVINDAPIDATDNKAVKSAVAALAMHRTITLYFMPSRIPLPAVASTLPGSSYYNPGVPTILAFESVADDFQFGFLVGPPKLNTFVMPD